MAHPNPAIHPTYGPQAPRPFVKAPGRKKRSIGAGYGYGVPMHFPPMMSAPWRQPCMSPCLPLPTEHWSQMANPRRHSLLDEKFRPHEIQQREPLSPPGGSLPTSPTEAWGAPQAWPPFTLSPNASDRLSERIAETMESWAAGAQNYPFGNQNMELASFGARETSVRTTTRQHKSSCRVSLAAEGPASKKPRAVRKTVEILGTTDQIKIRYPGEQQPPELSIADELSMLSDLIATSKKMEAEFRAPNSPKKESQRQPQTITNRTEQEMPDRAASPSIIRSGGNESSAASLDQGSETEQNEVEASSSPVACSTFNDLIQEGEKDSGQIGGGAEGTKGERDTELHDCIQGLS